MNDLIKRNEEARAAVLKAMSVANAIRDHRSPQWRAARALTTEACRAWRRTAQAVYDAGIKVAPEWWALR